MPDNKELANIIRAVMQEELIPVRQELQQVNHRLDHLETGQEALRQNQQETNIRLTAIEAAITDLKAINRRSHKEAFSQLNAIWADVKRIENRLDVQEKKAVR